MSTQFKLMTFIGLLLIGLTGCSPTLEPSLSEPETKRFIVSANDIPDVTDKLIQKMGLNTSIGNNQLTVNDGTAEFPFDIDWENIKQLIDSTGKETYTFGLDVNDGDLATFYNLVLRFDNHKNARQPFILKYSMDEGFLEEYLITGSLKGFRGKVQKILIDESGSLNNKSSASFGNDGALGSPCPGETPINGGGGGAPPSNGGGMPSYNCTTYIIETTWYSQTCIGNSCEDPVVVGVDYSYETECGYDYNNSMATASDPCDPETGEIPVIAPSECISFYINSTILSSCESDFKTRLVQALKAAGGYDLDQNNYPMNDAEIALAKKHPICAAMFYDNKSIAEFETIRRFGGNFADDCSDAFRHSFFNAMNSRIPGCGVRVAKLFSDAHETDVPLHNQYAIPMDLHNNSIGHSIGAGTGLFTTTEEIAELVCNKLANGEMKVFNNNMNLVNSSICSNCN